MCEFCYKHYNYINHEHDLCNFCVNGSNFERFKPCEHGEEKEREEK